MVLRISQHVAEALGSRSWNLAWILSALSLCALPLPADRFAITFRIEEISTGGYASADTHRLELTAYYADTSKPIATDIVPVEMADGTFGFTGLEFTFEIEAEPPAKIDIDYHVLRFVEDRSPRSDARFSYKSNLQWLGTHYHTRPQSDPMLPEITEATTHVSLMGELGHPGARVDHFELLTGGLAQWGGMPEVHALGDLNNDGRLDAAVGFREYTYDYGTEWSRAIVVVYQKPGDTFHHERIGQVTADVTAMAILDLDGDNRDDLVVGLKGEDTVFLYRQDVDGSLLPPVVQNGVFSDQMKRGDFNHDGHPDLACYAIRNGGLDIGLYYAQPDGSLRLGWSQYFYQWTAGAVLEVGDFDGDGRDDLLLANNWLDPSRIIFQTEDGIDGTDYLEFLFPNSMRESGVAVADLDHDGRDDIAIARGTHPYEIRWFKMTGDRMLVDGPVISFLAHTADALEAGDFNGDGRVDLVLISPGWSQLSIFMQKESGEFNWPERYGMTYASDFKDASALSVADFNSDGRSDIIYLDYNFGLGLMRSRGVFSPPLPQPRTVRGSPEHFEVEWDRDPLPFLSETSENPWGPWTPAEGTHDRGRWTYDLSTPSGQAAFLRLRKADEED